MTNKKSQGFDTKKTLTIIAFIFFMILFFILFLDDDIDRLSARDFCSTEGLTFFFEGNEFFCKDIFNNRFHIQVFCFIPPSGKRFCNTTFID